MISLMSQIYYFLYYLMMTNVMSGEHLDEITEKNNIVKINTIFIICQ